MELMGQWAPSVQASSSTSKKGLGDKLGFFPFPAVDGGKGSATEVFGGGNGFAVGKDAPPATVDFLKILLSVDNQRRSAKTGAVLPTVKDAADAVTDPNNKVVARRWPPPPASSSTSTRRTRRPSASRSTTASPRWSPAASRRTDRQGHHPGGEDRVTCTPSITSRRRELSGAGMTTPSTVSDAVPGGR